MSGAARLARVASRYHHNRDLIEAADHGDVRMTLADYERVKKQRDADKKLLDDQWKSGVYRGKLRWWQG